MRRDVSEVSEVSESGRLRMAVRAALLPTGLYLLVLVPVTGVAYAIVDARSPVPAPISWLLSIERVFGLCMAGWAGYRAAQWTRSARWASLAGLLVAAISEGLLLLPVSVIEASRSAETGGAGLTASNVLSILVYDLMGIGIDSLIGAVVGWVGYLVAARRARA